MPIDPKQIFIDDLYEQIGKDSLKGLTDYLFRDMTASPQLTKASAKILLEEHMGYAFAFSKSYDVIKYNYKVPISDANFERHKNKWHYIELAKYFENVYRVHMPDEAVVIASQYMPFLMFMYGEGYRNGNVTDITWINDIRNYTGLAILFVAWMEEKDNGFDILTEQLERMKKKYNLELIEDFKEFITVHEPVKGTFAEPHMWHAIGRSPEIRVNRNYVLSLQSFFLVDSALHLLDTWNKKLKGEPEWDTNYIRLSTYRKLYNHLYPYSSIRVRQIINSTLKFP